MRTVLTLKNNRKNNLLSTLKNGRLSIDFSGNGRHDGACVRACVRACVFVSACPPER